MKNEEKDALAKQVVSLLHNDKELTYKDSRKVVSRAYHMLTAEIKKGVKK